MHLESASTLSHPLESALSQVTDVTTNTTTTATAPPATPKLFMFNNNIEIEGTPNEANGPRCLWHILLQTWVKQCILKNQL